MEKDDMQKLLEVLKKISTNLDNIDETIEENGKNICTEIECLTKEIDYLRKEVEETQKYLL